MKGAINRCLQIPEMSFTFGEKAEIWLVGFYFQYLNIACLKAIHGNIHSRQFPCIIFLNE